MLYFSTFGEMVAYVLFFQMFSTFGYFSETSIFASVLIVLVRYIIGLIRKTEKFYAVPFIVTTAICIFYSTFWYEISAAGILQGVSLITALYFVFFAFTYRRTLNFQMWFEYLMWGILATAALSYLSTLFVSSDIPIVATSISRLKLFTQNENSLSIYCSLSLSYFVYALLNKKGNLIKNILFTIVSICFGFATYSKTFLLICIYIIAYLLIFLIRKYKIKSYKIVIAVSVLFGIICLMFKDTLLTTFDRFTIMYKGDHWLNNATTGRYDLWVEYKDAIISSIPKLLFGVGFFNKRLVSIGPHSLPIHIIYRMGLVGLILLAFLFYSYYKALGTRTQRKSKSFLPIIVLIMIGMVESFL